MREGSNLLFAGLLAGILFGDRAGTSPVRPTLSDACFVQYRQGLHVHFVPLMPILMALCILSAVVTFALVRRQSKRASAYALAAAVLSIAVLVLTRAINVPINQQLMTWTPASVPPDWLRTWTPWEQAHTIRTAIALTAFIAQLCAAARRD